MTPPFLTWLPHRGPLTAGDLALLPDDGRRYELFDGVLVVSPVPGMLHQQMLLQLTIRLYDAAPPGVLVLPGRFTVHPDPGGGTELQPDVLAAAEADYADDVLPVPPLLAVEITEPSTKLVDLSIKRCAYERMGTGCYWVLDPAAPELWAFELDDAGAYQQVARVAGTEVFTATRPFPVTICPGALLRRD